MKKICCLLFIFVFLLFLVSCGGSRVVDDCSSNTEEITTTGIVHNYGDSYKYDDDNHWKECDCGEKEDFGKHTIVGNECSI